MREEVSAMREATTEELLIADLPGPGNPETDSPLRETVLAAQRGSPDAFQALVQQLGPVVYRFLAVRLGNDGDARDALQETLVAAWQGLGSLRRPERVRAWMFSIAVRKAAAVARARSRLDLDVRSADRAVSDSSALVEVDAALRSLPGPMRDVVLLRHLVGLTEEETARVMGVRVGTVKSRAARARERIAAFLEHEDEGEAR